MYSFKVHAFVGDSSASPSTRADGVASAAATATPLSTTSCDNTPVLPAIADQTYTQGTAVDFTLPAATGGDGDPNYDYTLLPDVSGIGLTFTESTRKLTGTPSAPSAKVEYTYTATETSAADSSPEFASKTFTIGIAPMQPAGFTATAGNTEVTLGWTAIAGVSGWEYQQDSGSWMTISTRADTVSHLVPSLTNGTEYTFKVRAFVGSSDAQVIGVESGAESVTPAADLIPILPAITGKLYTQGVAVDDTLPEATGGDGHPNYNYTLTLNAQDAQGVDLTFSPSTRKLTGTPGTPSAKFSYTYKATETMDADGDTESGETTFTIGVQPMKPASFTAAPGDTEAMLSWTAIAGVSGWEVKQGSGSWTAISSSDATTASHTVTGLTNGTEYTFKVRAFVGGGSANLSTRVDGVESDAKSVTPSDDLAPVLPAVADKLYTQGVAVDDTLPEATGGDEGTSHPAYTYTLTPDVSGVGLTFNADDHQLSGRPGTPSAKGVFTYTATEAGDSDGTNESTSKTFTIGVRPMKPAGFTATGGNAKVTLSWSAIAGVSGWEYSKDDGATWTAVPSSSASTTSYTVTGLTNGTAYTFKLRAFVGSGGTQVIGVSSDGVTATPAEITAPTFSYNPDYHKTDWVFTQNGELAVIIFRRVIPGHPDNTAFSHRQLRHLLSPAVPSRMVVDTGVPPLHNMGGYPDTPMAKTGYTYTVVEKNPDDGTEVGRVSWTFNVSVKPKAPESFTATAGSGSATLSWTAIAGVTGWEVKQDSGTWTAMTPTGTTTLTHTVTSLTASTSYDFKIRAYVGAGTNEVKGVESDAKSVTPN